MRKSFGRIKGVGFLVWHGKHYLFHILLGLMWAWFLREFWQEFKVEWVVTAVELSSVLTEYWAVNPNSTCESAISSVFQDIVADVVCVFFETLLMTGAVMSPAAATLENIRVLLTVPAFVHTTGIIPLLMFISGAAGM